MIELAVLVTLLQHNTWVDYASSIDWPMLKQQNPEVFKIMLAVKQWHEKETTDLGLAELPVHFFCQFPGMSDKEKAKYGDIFEKLSSIAIRDGLVAQHMQQMKDQHIRMELARMAVGDKATNEQLIAFANKLGVTSAPEETKDEFVTTDLDELIEIDEKDPGLMWRLECLNKSVGPLRKGMFGTIMARVETGKTAMWVSEVTNFVGQISDDQHVCIFFNEEAGTGVMWRIYSALTGMSAVELESNPKQAKELFYSLGGQKIKFVDAAVQYTNQIYRKLDKLNPAVIVIDNLDKVAGYGEEKKVEKLGRIYQWARETSKIYAPVIGVSQASESGAHKKWLTMEDMADSKTAKPAELDFLIAIGRVDQAGYENTRYINLPKNKRKGNRYTSEQDRHGKYQITLNPELSRYEDA